MDLHGWLDVKNQVSIYIYILYLYLYIYISLEEPLCCSCMVARKRTGLRFKQLTDKFLFFVNVTRSFIHDAEKEQQRFGDQCHSLSFVLVNYAKLIKSLVSEFLSCACIFKAGGFFDTSCFLQPVFLLPPLQFPLSPCPPPTPPPPSPLLTTVVFLLHRTTPPWVFEPNCCHKSTQHNFSSLPQHLLCIKHPPPLPSQK